MKKTEENKNEIIIEILCEISNNIRFLGNGNADRTNGQGAIEGLAISISDSNKKTASAIDGISSTLETVDKSVNDLTSTIESLAESQKCKCQTEKSEFRSNG